jgi:hypothetical protein
MRCYYSRSETAVLRSETPLIPLGTEMRPKPIADDLAHAAQCFLGHGPTPSPGGRKEPFYVRVRDRPIFGVPGF